MAKKKPKLPTPPTQQDVTKGCIALQGITFRPIGFYASPAISGDVLNNCQREVYLSITVEYYNEYGTRLYIDFIDKLVSIAGGNFALTIDRQDHAYEARAAKVGRVTMVNYHF